MIAYFSVSFDIMMFVIFPLVMVSFVVFFGWSVLLLMRPDDVERALTTPTRGM